MNTVETYDPPYVLRFVGTLLAAPRKEYSRDISEFLAAAPNTFARDNYVSGLIFVVCILGGFLFLWSFVLLWMSFHGEYVGCAAGRPFEAAKLSRRKVSLKLKEKRGAKVDPESQPQISVGEVEATNEGFGSCSDMDEWSDVQSSPKRNSDRPDSTLNDSTSKQKAESPGIPRSVQGSCKGPSKQSFETDARATRNGSVDETVMPNPGPSMRERRTQFCFFLFAFAALLCVPFVLALSVKPLLIVTEVVNSILEEDSLQFDEAKGALSQLDEQSNVLAVLRQSIANTTYASICPMTADVRDQYNLNLESAYNLIAYQDPSNADQWESDLRETREVFESHDWVLKEIGKYNDLTVRYAWVPPVLLFLMGFLTLLLGTGVYLAWDRESSLRFQNMLSYTVLPLLAVCSLGCWIAVFGSAVTTSIAFDFCFSQGSPSQTITSVIQDIGYTFGSPMHDFTLNYVLHCSWSDPTEALNNEASRIQTIAELVRFTVSQADDVGRTELSEACGATKDETEQFLDVSSEIVSDITAMQSSITEATTFLSCEGVSDAYDALVNDAFCDVGASAFAWAFVFFLVAGVSTMCMISMRASWRHKFIEDRIFDESEVAENMVVDEHEDYLTFISKYRQEWEEYQGVGNGNGTGTNQIAQGSTDTLDDSFSTISNNVNMTDSAATDTLGDSTEVSEIKGTFDPYNSDSQSNTGMESEGSISFLSLKGSQEDDILPPLLTLGSDLEPEDNFDAEVKPPLESRPLAKKMSIVDRTPLGDKI